MSEQKTFPVIPGAQTPEGVARIERLSKARDDIDYEAYMLLRTLSDMGLLRRDVLESVMVHNGTDRDEAREDAAAYAEQVDEIMRRRRKTEHELMQALAGR